jgi:hypothetical protein
MLAMILSPLTASAAAYWSPALEEWKLHLDNGVIYISASNMPAHCAYSRAQIDTSLQTPTATYQRDLYAYVLAAYSAGKPLMITLHDDETTCKVYGAKDRP